MAESNLINNQVVSDSSLIDSQSEEKNVNFFTLKFLSNNT
jgi:hypothetical protein